MDAGRSTLIQPSGSVDILEIVPNSGLIYDIAVVERERGAEIARRVRPADAA